MCDRSERMLGSHSKARHAKHEIMPTNNCKVDERLTSTTSVERGLMNVCVFQLCESSENVR